MDVRLESIGRIKGSTNPSANKFPKTLSKERTIIIKIYDTAYNDPNKTIAQGAGSAVNAAASAFNNTSSIKAALKAGEAAVDDGGFLSSITDFADSSLKGIDAVGSGVKTAFNVTVSTYSDFASNFKDVGNRGLVSRGGADGIEKWMDSLYLPLPNEISETLQHNYSDTEGFAQSGLIGGVTGALSSPAKGASNIASKATGRQALIKNANKLVQFDSSAFRTISLSWTLIANNPEESIAIQNIITKLKAYSSPQAVSGKLLLRAPFFCRLEFPNKIIDNALQFHECVIESIEVNYSTSGHMETFVDDMPKTMSLTIKFQDREPKTLQAWAQGQKGYEAGDKG